MRIWQSVDVPDRIRSTGDGDIRIQNRLSTNQPSPAILALDPLAPVFDCSVWDRTIHFLSAQKGVLDRIKRSAISSRVLTRQCELWHIIVLVAVDRSLAR